MKKTDPELFHVEFLRDGIGEARWRLVSTANGRIVATIGEGNKKKSHVYEMVDRIFGRKDLQLVRNILGESLLSLDRVEQKALINEALEVIAKIQKRITVRKERP